jgi:hypothetical protein
MVALSTVGAPGIEESYDAFRDTSDLAEVDGIVRHTVPPESRQQAALYSPRNMRWISELPCVRVESASASAVSSANHPAATLDCDLRTRWTAPAGTSWIAYDLGRTCMLSSVSLVWYASRQCRAAFSIELSVDGEQFEQLDEGRLEGRGTSTALRTFVPVEARYVRITVHSPDKGTGLSLYEVGVHSAGMSQLSAQ